jgi:small subunit ribosomal protein S2
MQVTLQELLDAGCHFGHLSHRWNPKMARYIFGTRGGVHIINLEETLGALEAAVRFAEEVTEKGGQILFVGTKRQAAAIVAEQAKSARQPYITERWLGGTLTNFKTIRERVLHLASLEGAEESGEHRDRFTKKEQLKLSEERKKLSRMLSGIAEMGTVPAALFVVDIGREENAVREARSLGIPVIAIVDTNANPELADYPIPANDDAIRSIEVITSKIAEAAARGRAASQTRAGAEPVEAGA